MPTFRLISFRNLLIFGSKYFVLHETLIFFVKTHNRFDRFRPGFNSNQILLSSRWNHCPLQRFR